MKLAVEEYIQSRLQELDGYQERFSKLYYFLEKDELMAIPPHEKWSAAEVIEHLNAGSELYLPQWTAICKEERASTSTHVHVGWIARKLRTWMETQPKQGSKWNESPEAFQPRRLRDENLVIDPQKMLENFISDLDQVRKIIKIIPNSPTLSRKRVKTAANISLPALATLELYLPHIGRHLNQAERIITALKAMS